MRKRRRILLKGPPVTPDEVARHKGLSKKQRATIDKQVEKILNPKKLAEEGAELRRIIQKRAARMSGGCSICNGARNEPQSATRRKD